ncbi:MAG: hypothetical protein ACE5GB_13935 [Acidimicrobiales bacterium]
MTPTDLIGDAVADAPGEPLDPVLSPRLPTSLPVSVAILVAILVGVFWLTDTDGFLSTDVGGKIATLEAMAQRGDLRPDLGYWAESVDPDGSLYPMWSTTHIGDQWVNATTLPMIYAAYPLYRIGGARLAGLVPLVGTVVAALGARAVARRLGGEGRATFWIVGLASPATVYALDFWEHSIGLASMVWGVAFGLDASRPGGSWRRAAAAGAVFGLAASMRQEALVYGAVTGTAMGVRLLAGRHPLTAVGRGLAMATATVLALAANVGLEIAATGASLRSGRTVGTAGAAGSDVGTRVQEAFVTGLSPFARTDVASLTISLLLVLLLAELGRRAHAGPAEQRLVLIGLGAIALVMVLDLVAGGLGFVPGLVATTPVAALGLSRLGGGGDRRLVAVVAAGSLPLVWAVQFTGGAGPQWGGRYILTSGALLVALAATGLSAPPARSVLRGVAIGGLVVTLAGVAWTVQRSHAFADAMTELADRDEPALVFHDPFMSREAGALVIGEHWLSATGPEARAEAVAALAELGIDEVGFVDREDGGARRALPGWTAVNEERVELVSGLALRVTTWRAAG